MSPASARRISSSPTKKSPTSSQVAAALAAAFVVLGLALADGGFFPSAWGWATLAFAWAGLAAVLLRAPSQLSRLELLMLAAVAALLVWQLLSLAWTRAVPLTALEPQRTLLYIAALAAALLWLRRGETRALMVGIFAGSLAVCLWNLVFRWSAGETTGEEATPIGYGNGLGLIAVVTILLGAGLALETDAAARWVFAVACAPAVAVLWLSESRGAWIALGAGVVAGLASRGRRPALGLAVATGLGIVLSLAVGLLASDERRAYWDVALAEWADSPILGSGVGTWGRVWLERRDELFPALDAHSLYVEALSEIGPVALLLLAVALVVPLVAATRAAGRPGMSPAAAVWVALLVHLSVDWDWELPAVTAAGLGCAAVLLVSARSSVLLVPRGLGVAAAVVVIAVTVPLLMGNVLLSRSEEALRAGDATRAIREARRAARLQPWAAQPWRIRAEAELALGEVVAAANSVAEAIDRDPDDVEVWRTAARALEGEEQRRAVARAMGLDPFAAAPSP